MPLPIVGGMLAKWGSKMAVKVAIVLTIVLIMAGFWMRGDHFQKKALKLETQLAESQAALKDQRTLATNCTADLKRLETENKEAIKKFSAIQAVCNETIASYEAQLTKMAEERYTEVIIEVVDREDCPKIVQIKQDPVLEELRKGVD